MKKKTSYVGSEYVKGFAGTTLQSLARSAEILRVAKAMADKQHAENIQKLTEAKMSKKTKTQILASLKSRTR